MIHLPASVRLYLCLTPSALVLGVFLLPTLYVWVAGPDDILPEPERHHGEPHNRTQCDK